MSGNAASLYTWRGGVGGEGKLSCHTGTIDAEWSAVKDFIPYWLCSKSRDLLLYVKCWQWRYVNLHTHLQPKNDFNAEAPALKRKKEKPVNMSQWNESKTHKKRECCQIRLAEMSVSLWRKSCFLKTLFFTSTVSGPPGCFCLNAFEELVTVPTVCSWLADGCWWFAHICWRCLLTMQKWHKSVLFPARRTLNPRHFTFKLQTWENHSIFEQGFPDATHNPWLDFPVAREASIYNPSHYCILCIYAVRV